MFNTAKILVGDNRKTIATLEAGSVQTCITSPPYWGLRDYGQDDQIGLEQTPDEYVEQLCLVFDEVWRVLANDGTLWLNLGDSYLDKSLAGTPWQVAFALKARGWYLRSEIIWHKPNPMPESVTDRPTKSHEHIFLLTKSAKYFYDHEAIKEPVSGDWGTRDRTNGKYHNEGTGLNPHKGLEKEYDSRNKRDVWSVPTQGFPGAHFAVYPPALIEPCVLAGSRAGDTVLDPFSGSGTTGMMALRNGRNYVGCELNPEYAALSKQRIGDDCGMFGDVEVIGETG
jgi:DNA modification methylase